MLLSQMVRPRPALLRALGRREPPSIITVGGEQYELIEIFKHDSWAATALYQGAHGRMVVKLPHRQHPLILLPTAWLGRWFARHETRAYRMLHDVPGIARDGGEVRINGKRWSCAAGLILISKVIRCTSTSVRAPLSLPDSAK